MKALPAPAEEPMVGPDPDRPITDPTQDKFGRASLAGAIARYIESAPIEQSVVFALTGPWGAGKTSVLHLVEKQLTGRQTPTHVIWFNPWLFSGSREIATNFLRELAVQLGKKERDLKRIGDLISGYSDFFGAAGEIAALAVPAASVIVRAAKAIGAAGKATTAHADDSVRDARDRVEKALRESGRRFLVIIDDIDRLDMQEVREVFKLVRLVADFPNVSYLLSFDRHRVEEALSGGPERSGREYLAKIVQASFDLPQLDDDVLRRHLTSEIDRALAGREHGPFHEKEWPDILFFVIAPLVKTPRDATRLANAVAPVVELLGPEVALEDVLALEAIRLFLPEVLADIAAAAPYLTRDPLSSARGGDGTAVVQSLLKLGGPHEDAVRELLRRVFPPSRFAIDNYHFGGEWMTKWRKERRVACREVLDTYLARGIKSGSVPARLIRTVAADFGSAAKVEEHLGPLDGAQLESLMERLLDFHEDLAQDRFENGLVAILRHADRLRQGRAHFFDFGSDLAAERLVLQVTKAAPEERRAEAIRAVLDQVRSCTWRTRCLDLMSDHSVLGADVLDPLAAALRDEILGASTDQLLAERAPARVVAWATFDRASESYSEAARPLLGDPRVLRRVVASEVREQQSFAIGSVRTEVKHALPLVALASVLGGEEQLRTKLRDVVALGPADDGEDRLRIALSIATDFVEGRIGLSPLPDDDGSTAEATEGTA